MTNTTVLITGANRGLGRGFLEAFLARPNHVVIAGNRDPSHATSKALFDIPKGEGTKLIVVKIDSTVEGDAAAAVQQLRTEHGIDRLDIVVANAGIALLFPSVAELRVQDLQTHLKTNTFAVVWLYQATLPLLRKSAAATAKWVTLGSGAGVLENQAPIPNAAYGPSKAAVHWLTKRINGEEEKLTAFVVDPGFSQSDGGNAAARIFGLEEAPVKLQDSVEGVVKLIDESTKGSHGGKLWRYDGKQQAW